MVDTLFYPRDDFIEEDIDLPPFDDKLVTK
jgi:hypothetical protein